MVEAIGEIIPIAIEEELKQSYLDYAMSVIVGRALPDVRDGLKPVHRRALYAMVELGNDWNKPYKKSARIVGDVIGKYHPHSDVAVYDTLVRLAQTFSMRYVLVDGQGNFGSVDGDAPAAMRYTEIRLSHLAHSLMDDLDKETVDFVPNYDGSERIPSVLPARIPNLLVNGASGIAVGMATNIPPHNLREVIDATIAVIENPDISTDALMKFIPGPDFPTAGMIIGRQGIIEAYKTGRGRISVRAKTEIEHDVNNRSAIIVTELPYQVNKARLLEKIGDLVRHKQIEGICALRDESDKQGMRVVIEIKRGDNPEVVLNNLFLQTQLQTIFGINMVALDNGQPRVLQLKQMLGAFLQHRREVVMRRSLYELRKAGHRAHLLEGLTVALGNMDALIALIKKAQTPAIAKQNILAQLWDAGVVAQLLEKGHNTRPDGLAEMYGVHDHKYKLSPEQAQAILDLRLHRLTGLEIEKIREEYFALIERINELLQIISDSSKLHQVIRGELIALKDQFGDERKTVILNEEGNFTQEDLIASDRWVVTLSYEGYIKSQALSSYAAQHRGGRGKIATLVKEEDFVKHILIAYTHDVVLCFSTQGKVYGLKVYQIPQGSRVTRGRPIINLLSLEEAEAISAILPIRDFKAENYVFMATEKGYVKKVPLCEFANLRQKGKIALQLEPGDHLVAAALTDGKKEILLMTDVGKAIRFHENDVRSVGRSARGVRGISLKSNQSIISLIVVDKECALLTATAHGYGQRTSLEDYRIMHRGGQGVQAIQVNARNGKVIGAAFFGNFQPF